MTTVLIVAASIVGAIVLAGALVGDVLPRVRDRRARRANLRDVEQRVAALDALPPPSAIPQARNPTKAEVRSQRGRRHPIAHKRGGRPWGL